MPKTKISEFSATPANNTDIDSINIAEGCAPSGINDAIRELMAQLKDFQTGAVGDSFNGPVGTTTAAAGAFTTLAASGAVTLSGGTANGVAYLNGSKVVTSGSALTFDGTTLGNSTSGTPLSLNRTGAGTALIELKQSGTVGSYLGTSGASDMIFFNGSAAELMRLNGTGLGIGTSSPSQKLDVRGNMYMAATNARIYIDNGGVGGSSIQLGASGTSHGYVGTDGNFPLVFQPNNTERMRLDSSGNLGIGTSSPSASDWNASATVVQANKNDTNGGLFKASSSNTNFIFSAGNNLAYLATTTNTPITFWTNTVERMRLDSAGNLGLGVTPSAWRSNSKALQIGSTGSLRNETGFTAVGDNYFTNTSNQSIYLTSATASLYYQSSGSHAWLTAPSGTAGNAITFTQAMTLDASGNLGVGTTSPATRLEVNGVSEGEYFRAGGGTISARSLQFSSFTVSGLAGVGHQINVPNASGVLTFATGSTERARIDSSGNLLVGTTSNPLGDRGLFASPQSTNNTLALVSTDDSSGGTFIAFRNSAYTAIGTVARVTTTNAVVYNTTSDYRLKTVTGAVTGQGARIDALKPIDYLWTEGGQQARGFLAHEFQEVYPNSVTGDKDAVDANGNPVYQAMQASTAEVIADLVAEIQSLRKRLADAGI